MYVRIRVTIVAVEKQYVLHIKSVCLHSSLRYPARNEHAPCYFVICVYSFLSTLSYKRYDFREKKFEKHSNIIFYENPSSGSRVVPCGQTDRHDEANSRFRNFAKALTERKHSYDRCGNTSTKWCRAEESRKETKMQEFLYGNTVQ